MLVKVITTSLESSLIQLHAIIGLTFIELLEFLQLILTIRNMKSCVACNYAFQFIQEVSSIYNYSFSKKGEVI